MSKGDADTRTDPKVYREKMAKVKFKRCEKCKSYQCSHVEVERDKQTEGR